MQAGHRHESDSQLWRCRRYQQPGSAAGLDLWMQDSRANFHEAFGSLQIWPWPCDGCVQKGAKGHLALGLSDLWTFDIFGLGPVMAARRKEQKAMWLLDVQKFGLLSSLALTCDGCAQEYARVTQVVADDDFSKMKAASKG
eukprot:scaffold28052_cov19-Tisochrysis_lutea.AAC.1